jgi:hypothetical protein
MSQKMKHSAYKSMQLAKEGKTKKKDGKLKIWVNEKWVNLNALRDKKEYRECGSKYKGQTEPTVCRPRFDKSTKKHKTPKPLADQLTKKQISKAIELKKKGKRVNWATL